MIAWITGAGRGVGRAAALALADRDAALLLTDLGGPIPECPYPLATAAELEETAQRCRARGARVLALPADVRDPEAVEEAAARGRAELGPVDVLVNNAGLVGPSGVPAHELTEAAWSLVLEVDLGGAWRCARAVLGHMAARREGAVVNVASTAGLVAFPMFANYVAAKHGLIGLTRALALDYAPYSVRVNAVCPTSIRDDPTLDSGMLAGVAGMLGLGEQDYEALSLPHHPLGRLVDAEDVAQAIVWLASPAARSVTGAALPVDAGFTVR